MTQQVRILAPKSGDLNSIPRPTWWKERTPKNCSLTSTRIPWHAAAHKHMYVHTNTHNKVLKSKTENKKDDF